MAKIKRNWAERLHNEISTWNPGKGVLIASAETKALTNMENKEAFFSTYMKWFVEQNHYTQGMMLKLFGNERLIISDSKKRVVDWNKRQHEAGKI